MIQYEISVSIKVRGKKRKTKGRKKKMRVCLKSDQIYRQEKLCGGV